MKTEYTIFQPGHASGERHEIDWPREPGYQLIKALVQPLLDAADLEHVSVLYEGRRHDMFVDEIGAVTIKYREPLPVNDRATEIYRANWLSQHPEVDADSMPAIHGVAVLFHRIVWT